MPSVQKVEDIENGRESARLRSSSHAKTSARRHPLPLPSLNKKSVIGTIALAFATIVALVNGNSTLRLYQSSAATVGRQHAPGLFALAPTSTRLEEHVNVTRTRIRRCEKALLFSWERSGSTWLLNSIERCKFSSYTPTGRPIFHESIFDRTEIWHHFGEHYIDKHYTPHDAVVHLVRNGSLKIFQSAWDRRRAYILALLRSVQKKRLPVFVLDRRDADAVWRSLHKAVVTGDWNMQHAHPSQAESSAHASDKTAAPKSIKKQKKEDVLQERSSYFKDVLTVLRDEGIVFDRFWYEDVKDLPAIVAPVNHCVIRNCNFPLAEHEAALHELGFEELP